MAGGMSSDGMASAIAIERSLIEGIAGRSLRRALTPTLPRGGGEGASCQ